jgi:ferredoxin-NADP reductase/MOSC domain-containing protein YiiM
MVYQTESYEHWQRHFGRNDLRPGMFGENFTITGLSDDDVCIGDRYRIGTAEFEVTQPRVTCFRVGMRLGEPDMPNLLVAQHRPGFYFRVITEGLVAAGDEIVRTRRGRHQLSVADIDALLYLPDRDLGLLRKAVDIPALSPGWQQSFAELLTATENPSAAAAPQIGVEPGWHGFRTLRVAATRRESASVVSIELETTDGTTLPTPRPGQFLTLRIPAGDPAPLRSYSLSNSGAQYRISVKRAEHGRISSWIHDNLRVGTLIEAAAPRGDFYLGDEDHPVILISAGIGITPVLAMLHALAARHSEREIWWLHITRDAHSLAFGAEVGALIDSLPNARHQIFYTAETGRPDAATVEGLGLPSDAIAYLCGPETFMTDMRGALAAAGIASARIHSELFGALPPINPGITDAPHRTPHLPAGPPGPGPAVSFARSGITVNWSSDFASLLELAEACDVATRFSCRSGVCHMCVTPLVDGTITYPQPPLELPAEGSVLICSAHPSSGVVLDL